MRDYAKVAPTFWTGETGRQLRKCPDAQRVAFYLLTCPSANMIGLYYLPIPTLMHELGMTRQGASKALRRLSEGAFAHHDEGTDHVWIPEMARYQLGETLKEGDKRIIAVKKILNENRKCMFFNDFMKKYGDAYCLDFEAPSKPLRSPSEAPSKPESSEQRAVNREQRREEKPTTARKPRANGQSQVFNFDLFKQAYPTRSGAQPWSRAAKAANARIKDGSTFDDMVAGAVRYCEYCNLTNKTNTEFVMQAATFLGPERHYLEPWDVPKDKSSNMAAADEAIRMRKEREKGAPHVYDLIGD